MVAVIGPQKLPFQVNRVSSEDPDYPACDLLVQHPDCHGWQSERFCRYPQEVELRLTTPSRLVQLQILAHESKIPEKIDIYVSNLPPGCSEPARAVERRLGHLRFNDGERAGHQTRELKTVQFQSVPALFLRLEFSKCHVNQYNIYNQVGLIAINLVGALRPTSPACAAFSS